MVDSLRSVNRLHQPPRLLRVAAPSLSGGWCGGRRNGQPADALQRVAQGAPLPADPHGLSSQCPTQFGVPATACTGFRLQTEDGAWHDATATVGHDGRHVELRCNATGAVVASSFGYSPWVVNSIFTKSGLPLLPWAPKSIQKTDDVLPPTVINSSLVHSDMYDHNHWRETVPGMAVRPDLGVRLPV